MGKPDVLKADASIPVQIDQISLTRPLLPELDALIPYLQDILERRWVTNNGVYVQRLERELQNYLGVKGLATVTNATVGLDLAVRALVGEGEVITTAYSFPATYHVLLNNPKISPVFADIDENFCLDPESVVRHITHKTRAILAVHTYGFPCKVDRLAQIAQEHGLKVIYDAAPAFGVRINGKGIASYGDLSVFSFHATKVFNTVEGGCISLGKPNPELLERIRLMRNFGIVNEHEIALYGINGKMDEVRAAFGLVTLGLVESAIEKRRQVVKRYLSYFEELKDPNLVIREDMYSTGNIHLNYAYFPVLIHPSKGFNRNTVYNLYRREGILVRKYFYPTIVNSPIYNGLYSADSLPNTLYASNNVLCLPVHHEMTGSDCDRIIQTFDRIYRATH